MSGYYEKYIVWPEWRTTFPSRSRILSSQFTWFEGKLYHVDVGLNYQLGDHLDVALLVFAGFKDGAVCWDEIKRQVGVDRNQATWLRDDYKARLDAYVVESLL